MADNVRYHSKTHARQHHTKTTEGYYDSGIDPIASSSSPFLGDFYLSGGDIYTYNSYLTSTDGGTTFTDIANYFVEDTSNFESAYTTVNAESAHWTNNAKIKHQVITSTGVKDYQLNFPVNDVNSLLVSIEGVVQLATTHYTVSTNSSRDDYADIKFLTAPSNSEVIMVKHLALSGAPAGLWTQSSNDIYYNSGKVGIGTTAPGATLDVRGSDGYLKFDTSGADGTIKSDYNLRLYADDNNNNSSNYQNIEFYTAGGNERMRIASTGNVGIGTSSPGQILDVNSGAGNMIADGYDTHSLAVYKENIEDASGYLDKIKACPAQKWNRKPFISANKIKEVTIEEFGEEAWMEYFPDKTSHKNKALYNMPEGDMKTWIDEWCETKRTEMRPEAKWQQKKLGLVADAESTAEHLPEVIAINDDGEPAGIDTMTYIGVLHSALQETLAKVESLETRIEQLEAE